MEPIIVYRIENLEDGKGLFHSANKTYVRLQKHSRWIEIEERHQSKDFPSPFRDPFTKLLCIGKVFCL